MRILPFDEYIEMVLSETLAGLDDDDDPVSAAIAETRAEWSDDLPSREDRVKRDLDCVRAAIRDIKARSA